jgi:hypothetical protein
LALLAFLTAAGVRVAYLLVVEHDYAGLPVRVDGWADLAESLATGHGYALRSVVTGEFAPTAWRMPLYPLLLSLVFRVAEDPERLGLLMQCVLDGLTATGLFLIGWRAMGRVAGVAAAAIWAGMLPEWHLVSRFWSEPLFVLLLVTAVAMLWRAGEVRTTGAAAGAGLALGLLGLTRPVGALLAVPALIWLVIVLGGKRSRVWAAVGVTLLVLAPWTARNAAVFDTLIPFDTTGGLNVAIGTLGTAPYAGYDAFGPELAERLERVDEVTADRMLRQEAGARLLADPAGHLRRSLERLGMFFFWPADPAVSVRPPVFRLLAHGALYALAAAGFLSLRGSRRRFAWLLVAVIGGLALVHAQILAQPRFLVPALPLFALLAGSAVQGGVRLATRNSGGNKKPRVS